MCDGAGLEYRGQILDTRDMALNISFITICSINVELKKRAT